MAPTRGSRTVVDAAGRSHVRAVTITPADRAAAAARFRAARAAAAVKGTRLGAKGPSSGGTIQTLSRATVGSLSLSGNPTLVPAATLQPEGTVPHYFGPYGNWAYSPLPKGPVGNITVDDGGSGYSPNPTVLISDVYGTGTGATAHANVVGGVVVSITIDSAGTNYSAPFVAISDFTGVDAVATARVGGLLTSGLRKFVDPLPMFGNDIPIAVKDTTTYPGSDYYEIAAVEFTQKMHSDMPPTRLRGYVQLSTVKVPGAQVALTYPDGSPILVNGQPAYGVTQPRYLGPTIIAERNRPVRVLFRNLLPIGQGGNLFIPVDTTFMGAGMGPEMGGMADPDPQNPMCGKTPKPMGCYTENRQILHLHGGRTPWISDGTPHQWIAPAGEDTPYKKGASASNVSDMPDPGDGAETFFYTNQQSARLMFYHDHAWGITRLNVYAGGAAGYIIRDSKEQELITNNIIPADEIPLVVQDKTFTDADLIAAQDPTWRWGLDANGNPVTGNLWVPHVYMPAQNPNDPTGTNAFGRWFLGAWFWPPNTDAKYPPIQNPYYDPNCDQDVTGWCEPPLIPGTPNNSAGMEAFNDTPIVNGVAYPTTTLDPKPYRLRILNAANDRFFNLQWYVADSTGTEVALNPGELAAAQLDPNVVPTPNTAVSPAGPSWIQIGTEGGFLPQPVVIPNQPITWITDQTRFDFGNVDKHSLLLAPAERADVIVDFSQFKGKTLILYNDAPAAFPGRVSVYDYYTGDPDQTAAGGAPSTIPGYGPNTRTVMRITVSNGTPQPFNLVTLQNAFAHQVDANNIPTGVFESSQDPIIVGQSAYNKTYGTTFRSAAPRDGFARIADMSLTFNTLLTGNTASTLTLPFENKALHDETNSATFDPYGRMTANMGLEAPGATPLTQNIILYPYINPVTEKLQEVTATGPIATADDGTQIWKITHNGVDTHPIHFHLFDVQLINRITWDNRILPPDPNELGWKETVRVSPLEDTIVAIRPRTPQLPFGILDSWRYLDPSMPENSTEGFNSIDANGNAITPPISNQKVNFGWEYVWHCHILGHEEMDMMRPMSYFVARALPAAPSLTAADTPEGVVLNWTDGTPINYTDNPIDYTNWGSPAGEVGYRVERASVDGSGVIGDYSIVAWVPANVTTYTDSTLSSTTGYSYRVVAYNAAGDSPSAPLSTPAPAASVTPSSLTFASQLVFTTSDLQSVALSNTGQGVLSILGVTLSGANAPDFATGAGTCGSTLAPGQTCVIDVTFTPSARGLRSAALIIASNDPINPTLNVPLTGTGYAIIVVSPLSLTFPTTDLGSAASAQTVTVQNVSGAPVTVTPTISGSFWIASNGCSATINPNTSCMFWINYYPTAAGVQMGQLTITPSTGNAQTVNLSGTGNAFLGVNPTTLTFAATTIGSAPGAQTVALTNRTGSSITIGAAISGSFWISGNGCTGVIAPNTGCTIWVNYYASASGTQTGQLTLTPSTGSSRAVVLTGTGVASVTVTPTSLTFSPTNVGRGANSQTVTITNKTGVGITVAASISGSFWIATNGCSGTIPTNTSCRLWVNYYASAVGAQTGTLTVTPSVGTAQTVSLTGTGQ